MGPYGLESGSGHDNEFVLRQAVGGRPYPVREVSDLRRVPDILVNAVVFLYPTEDMAVRGKGYGGSGFLVGMTDSDEFDPNSPPPHDPIHAYVVTNAHVAAECQFARTSHPLRPIIRIDSWTKHPDGDDVAIAHVGIAGATRTGLGKIVHRSLFMTRESFASNQIGPGGISCS